MTPREIREAILEEIRDADPVKTQITMSKATLNKITLALGNNMRGTVATLYGMNVIIDDETPLDEFVIV